MPSDSEKNPERPACCEDRHLGALDRIREMGVCNMYGAADPLRQCFPSLTEKQATDILVFWMSTFGKRQEQANA